MKRYSYSKRICVSPSQDSSILIFVYSVLQPNSFSLVEILKLIYVFEEFSNSFRSFLNQASVEKMLFCFFFDLFLYIESTANYFRLCQGFLIPSVYYA